MPPQLSLHPPTTPALFRALKPITNSPFPEAYFSHLFAFHKWLTYPPHLRAWALCPVEVNTLSGGVNRGISLMVQTSFQASEKRTPWESGRHLYGSPAVLPEFACTPAEVHANTRCSVHECTSGFLVVVYAEKTSFVR